MRLRMKKHFDSICRKSTSCRRELADFLLPFTFSQRCGILAMKEGQIPIYGGQSYE